MKKLVFVSLIILTIGLPTWAQDSIPILIDGPDYPSNQKMHIYPSAILSCQPQFLGGNRAFERWIAKHSRFTQAVADSGNFGKVYCELIIDSVGIPKYPRIISSTKLWLAEETIRIVGLLPNFIPGKYRPNDNVTTKYILTFRYLPNKGKNQGKPMVRNGNIIICPKQ